MRFENIAGAANRSALTECGYCGRRQAPVEDRGRSSCNECADAIAGAVIFLSRGGLAALKKFRSLLVMAEESQRSREPA